jgi:hypothetical protein
LIAEVLDEASEHQILKERLRQMLRNTFELKFGGNARHRQRAIVFKSDALNTKNQLGGIALEIAPAFLASFAAPCTFGRITRNGQTGAFSVVVATETIQSRLQTAHAAEEKRDTLPGFQCPEETLYLHL